MQIRNQPPPQHHSLNGRRQFRDGRRCKLEMGHALSPPPYRGFIVLRAVAGKGGSGGAVETEDLRWL